MLIRHSWFPAVPLAAAQRCGPATWRHLLCWERVMCAVPYAVPVHHTVPTSLSHFAQPAPIRLSCFLLSSTLAMFHHEHAIVSRMPAHDFMLLP